MWSLFCLQNSLNSLCHRVNKVLKTLFRGFGLVIVPPYSSCSTASLIWWLWRPFVSLLSCSRDHLKWLELCDIMCYPIGSSHEKMDTLRSLWDGVVSNNTRIGFLVLLMRRLSTMVSPTQFAASRSLNCWNKAGWIHPLMLFLKHSDSTIQMLLQNAIALKMRSRSATICGLQSDFGVKMVIEKQ